MRAGFLRGHAGATCQPWPVARRSPSAPRRARLTAAASREKSAATLVGAADSGAAPAVAAAHQVTDLAFHLGPGGPVVGDPGGIGLGGAGTGQLSLVGADRDGAAGGRAWCTARPAGSRRRPRRTRRCRRRCVAGRIGAVTRPGR